MTPILRNKKSAVGVHSQFIQNFGLFTASAASCMNFQAVRFCEIFFDRKTKYLTSFRVRRGQTSKWRHLKVPPNTCMKVAPLEGVKWCHLSPHLFLPAATSQHTSHTSPHPVPTHIPTPSPPSTPQYTILPPSPNTLPHTFPPIFLPQHLNTLSHTYSSGEKLLPPPPLCAMICCRLLYFNCHLCAVSYKPHLHCNRYISLL